MSKYNSRERENYEYYNFQGSLIQNIGESLFELEYKISKAYEERPSAYLNALSSSRTFMSKLVGMDLKILERDKIKVKLYLDIAKKLFELNNLPLGCEYLSKTFEKIWAIVRSNGMAFPKSRKVTSFKDWAEQQL